VTAAEKWKSDGADVLALKNERICAAPVDMRMRARIRGCDLGRFKPGFAGNTPRDELKKRTLGNDTHLS
jgi:hypothetical protein